MQRQTHAYERRLDAYLVLRSVRDERDVERFAALNTAINGADQGMTCAQLLRHHPDIRYDDFLYIEDESTGEIVSTTCLIPWQCKWDGVMLQVAMLEMVATHPAYRQRGLVRAQIERFHAAVSEQAFDLSIIEGIPYYYRQFGYAYAGDHWGYDVLPVGHIPASAPDEPVTIALRRATVVDIPALTRLYDAQAAQLSLGTLRSPAYWQFLLTHAQYPVWLVTERLDKSVLGYCCKLSAAGGRTPKIVESVLTDQRCALQVLQQLAEETGGEIHLGWPASTLLVQLGRTLGSQPGFSDQWLLRLTDIPALLTKLAPVFEDRLASAQCANISTPIVINLFRHAFALDFRQGKLVQVEALGFVDASMGAHGGDLCIPPDAFVRLLIGYRTLAELQDAWPDIVIQPERRYLLDALFRKQESFFCLPYLYRGPLE